MKKNKFIQLFLLPIVAISFLSCKPDVNLTSDYRDITVVYGLLNPLDQNHYIKIYKGYLTKENALVWANELDNISYYDEIDVQLIEHKPNGEVVTYPMDTVMSVGKNYGTFASPTQVLYRPVKNLTNHRPVPIREGCLYQLEITNKKTGRKVTSETTTLSELSFDIPQGGHEGNVSSFLWYKDELWSVGTKIMPENASAIDAYMTFRYIEKNKTTGDTVHKSIDDIRLTTGFVYGNIASFKPSTILRIIGDNIEPNDNVWRYADDDGKNKKRNCLDIKLWACDEVYYKYYKTAQPSSSIVQDRVNYTNIKADDDMALGFFASRTYKVRRFSIYNMDDYKRNEDSLVYGQWTKNLNFRPYDEMFD